MTPSSIKTIMLRLAELKAKPETSHSLRRYIEDALGRDPVDVLNELEVLAEISRPYETATSTNTGRNGLRER